jgi:cell division transport system ATP-binding protein
VNAEDASTGDGAATALIQLFHVTKTYGRDQKALDDVTLRIDKGDFVFLTGPSGAGKTTLLKLLFCAEAPTRGQVILAGRNIHRMRSSGVPLLRRNIGVIFQDFKLLQNRSVFDNVAFAMEVLGRPPREIKRRVTVVLRQVGLGDKLSSLPSRLSGGEQQRVAIARALVNEPLLLLADEPTGNLDPELTFDIMNLLNEVNARGTTVMVATHDPLILQAFPKRRVMLTRGRVVEDER